MEALEANRVNVTLHAENVRVFDTTQEKRLPVTIVTGFLGAGKTTLLNHILSNKSNLRIAAAVNDFAQLNIDKDLIHHKNSSEKVVELSNGCVCCRLLGDLEIAIHEMLSSREEYSYVIIETSGVSDPLDIIRKLDQTWGKCYRARLDSVVTVVDADRFLHDMKHNKEKSRISETAVAQLKHADIVILNKMDLLQNKAECNMVQGGIRLYNTDATIYRTTKCNVPLSAILDVQVPNNNNKGSVVPITHESTSTPVYVSATGGALRRASSQVLGNKSSHNNANDSHLSRDAFVSVSCRIDAGPLSLSKLSSFFTGKLVHGLARIKGILWIQGLEEYRCVVHLSGRGRLGFELDGHWTGPPVSEMAFIGTNPDVQALEQAFQDCCHVDPRDNTDQMLNTGSTCHGVELLQTHAEFCVLEQQPLLESYGICLFYLTGSKVYGYSEQEIETNLCIDTNAMNRDLADAVNASVVVEPHKAFVAYTCLKNGKVVLCYNTLERREPANNWNVLLQEAKKVLLSHFRNVQVCKCGV